MAYTKAGMKAVDKYVKNNYDSFLVRVPKGRKETIEECAKAQGESVNGYGITYHAADWCNKNHFDYRGLIPLGLAEDTTGLGIYD